MSSTAKIKRPSLVNWKIFWLIITIISLIWSLQTAGVFQQELVNLGGLTLVEQFLNAAFYPELSQEFLKLTLEASLKTLSFAVCGTFFSILIGLIGGLFSSEIWWRSLSPHLLGTPWLFIRSLLAIPRSIHEAIWGLFFVNIFGLDPLVAIFAIAIPFGTITAKVFSDILDETPRQALTALLSSGVSPLNAFLYTLFPQAFLNLLSYTFYRFECSIRSATLLGIIGAGGLGYQILLSLQSLRYHQVWTLLIALVILTGLTDLWSSTLRHRLGAPSRLDLNILQLKTEQSYSKYSKNLELKKHHFLSFFTFSGYFTLVLIVFSFWEINADFSKLLSPRTWQLFVSILQEAFPPDFSQLQQLLILSQQTLALSILAIIIAGLGGILLSFPAANNFSLPGGIFDFSQYKSANFLNFGTLIWSLSRLILLFFRAIPEPIWALIFLFILFPGILPGAIALGLHNLGILGRLMAEVTENLDPHPLRSLSGLGATRPQVFLYGVLPLTLPRFIAYILYRWEVCIRATVIVGLVGAGGLGRLLTEQLSSFDYRSIFATLIVFISLTLIVDFISHFIRQTLRE
ncbi:ABC transporter permease [Lyngbya sp. PCC 8106]|uniref:PhnE/PtxC family ABC transporter permease n=1 Tax=Lyngbya sp. (strain PCC 8106) TaxID=313612 RepID=UPI0000EA8F5A|nr:ABC transporter permease subunit [Lyngbya sp. PCC 8106]EAW36183.1 ABC-type phosphate/phosphonate transport system permease component [Lyngbya sp. PCC 8106]